MEFKDMELISKPNKLSEPNGHHFVYSNLNNFMSSTENKAVCDEVASRFNDYPKLVELATHLIHIAKIVDESCFSEISDKPEVNEWKRELQELIRETDGLINKID